MTALRNRAGPTRIWRTLKGKDVKTNDGKDLGEIKDISENYIHVEKGVIHKESFWIPKYVADAYDGKRLWLLMDEEELRGKYQYGKEPSEGDKFTKDFESFKGTPYGQNLNYGADFCENIRFVENYKNIRDLHMAQSEERHSPGEEQTHVHKKVETSKQNERKEKEKPFNKGGVEVPEYTSIPIKLASPKTIERPVQPVTASSSPVRLKSQISSGTIKTVVQQDRSRAPAKSTETPISTMIANTVGSPIRITTETPISTRSPITSTTIAAASNISSVSSSEFPTVHSGEKEIVPKSTLDSIEVDDITLPVRKESAAIMVAASTSITPNKEMNIKPVLKEPIPMLKVTTNKEEQNIILSETNNKSNLLPLTTSKLPTVFLGEIKPISSNSHAGQLTPQGDRIETTENVKPMMYYYFKPFLGSMGMWQSWIEMYNEFAMIWIRWSLNWSDQFWDLFGRSVK